ncbi:hypothetical protein RB599_008513 [Gaeumannomyces hyphopodioides]
MFAARNGDFVASPKTFAETRKFFPEDIPTGVYTHLNFAFVSVNPETYEVVPDSPGDVDLLYRLTDLKLKDSALKVYVAIGGWSFNNPGWPTANVFGDLAESEEKQRVFFRSLISFMETYNFDGVDIDWEYPAATDRAGRPGDYQNFPKFIANLKSAISGTGRGGLTLTLPVSYWYLKNFDIVKLEPNVEFFNMMSYDLHGGWDNNTKGMGPYLNSHTNLTEIRDYFDLVWRNSISPSKVVMGLGFYSRTFRAKSLDCMSPGCLFSSAGDPGPCTNEGGIISNSEVDKILSEGTTEFDREAAVKILKRGHDWITYDDGDTFKLKADFARSQCLGGVMVWAVSLDKTDGSSSKQLQLATGYKSRVAKYQTDSDSDVVTLPDVMVDRSQCRWSNCGEGCPAGFTTVQRHDDSSWGEQIMLDRSGCRRDGGDRVFCCPASKPQPSCGWFDFNNGRCGASYGSKCPPEWSLISQQRNVQQWGEIAGYSGDCNNGREGFYQVACCSVTESTKLYGRCEWNGRANECANGENVHNCDNYDKMNYLEVLAWSGSGTSSCYYDGGRSRKDRPYCCEPPETDLKWEGCEWRKVKRHDDGFCEAECSGDVKVAVNGWDKEELRSHAGCRSGAQHYCCKGGYHVKAKDGEIAEKIREALLQVVNNQGTCPNVTPGLSSKRGLLDGRSDLGDFCLTVAYAVKYIVMKENDDVTQFVNPVWKEVVGGRYPNLENPETVMDQLLGLEYLEPKVAQSAVVSYQSSLGYWDRVAASDLKEDPIDCPRLFSLGIYEFSGDEEDGGQDYGPDIDYELGGDPPEGSNFGRRSLDEGHPTDLDELLSETSALVEELQAEGDRVLRKRNDSGGGDGANSSMDQGEDEDSEHDKHDEDIDADLEKRGTGSERTYTVRMRAINDKFTMSSSSYPNGGDGDVLIGQSVPRSAHRFMVKWAMPQRSLGNKPARRGVKLSCTMRDFMLVDDADKRDATSILSPGGRTGWVTEHIMELQTIPRFLDFLLDGGLRDVDPAGIEKMVPPGGIPVGHRELKQYLDDGSWQEWDKLERKDPLDHILSLLGSDDHLGGMVVAERDLNGVKSRLYRFNKPVNDRDWRRRATQLDDAGAIYTLSVIYMVHGVFQYYDHPEVKARHKGVFQAVLGALEDWDTAWRRQTGRSARAAGISELWETYMDNHMERVTKWANWWVHSRIDLIWSRWNAECIRKNFQRPQKRDENTACRMVKLLRKYQFANVEFDSTIFKRGT